MLTSIETDVVKAILAGTLSLSGILLGVFGFIVGIYKTAQTGTPPPGTLEAYKNVIRGILIVLGLSALMNLASLDYLLYTHVNFGILIGFFVGLVLVIPIGGIVIAKLTKVL